MKSFGGWHLPDGRKKAEVELRWQMTSETGDMKRIFALCSHIYLTQDGLISKVIVQQLVNKQLEASGTAPKYHLTGNRIQHVRRVTYPYCKWPFGPEPK